MSSCYYSFGDVIEEKEFFEIASSLAIDTLAACLRSKDFEVIELQKRITPILRIAIIVDCVNCMVPTRNTVGIKTREKLALVFNDDSTVPTVLALRKSFPRLPHMYSTPKDEPLSLCLYFATWEDVKVNWTAKKHLDQIFWWLEASANETLHMTDQPLENLFFSSYMTVVLPEDYHEKKFQQNQKLIFYPVEKQIESITIRSKFIPNETLSTFNQESLIDVIEVVTQPIVHGKIEDLPRNIQELFDTYSDRGVDLIPLITEEYNKHMPHTGLKKKDRSSILIFIYTQIIRSADSLPEKYSNKAFLVDTDLCTLGFKLHALLKQENTYYIDPPSLRSNILTPEDLSQIHIHPAEIKIEMSKKRAQEYSGINASSDFSGLLMGLGALGGLLAELWSKSGWGKWNLIDNDILNPHNIARHILKNADIGLSKSLAVKKFIDNNYSGSDASVALVAKATNWDDEGLLQLASSVDIIVDVTTTRYVPQHLSRKNGIARSCSVFLTPSGNGVVLMLEDCERNIRLDSLECLYYREMINQAWGVKHLDYNLGYLWTGGSCRDISVKISYDKIMLAAALLVNQLRVLRDKDDAALMVWDCDSDNVMGFPVIPPKAMCQEVGGWTINYDQEIHDKIMKYRQIKQPSETGGVILGFLDSFEKRIYIVDVLPAPIDSIESPTSFVRGKDNLLGVLNEVKRRTANIVDYLGEWHSHPDGYFTSPSNADIELLKYLSERMGEDGLPALMLIANDKQINFVIEHNV